MRVLLIDDLRNIKADRVARTFEDGLKALAEEGPWDLLYLDHDLGDENPKHTGYGIMCFLEEQAFLGNRHLLPAVIRKVTSNPVGWNNIQLVIDNLYKEK